MKYINYNIIWKINIFVLLQAPVGAAVKPGIFGKLWSATEIVRKANHAVSLLTYLLNYLLTDIFSSR